ncbi:MAG: sulfate adenylyltransferase, partial [Corynebacterium sp.]|nr:sulfate adenylyltransferase [Corynebacterium sp.]
MTAPTLNPEITADNAAAAAAGAAAKISQRETLRLCTAGSVDDGKSTFVGRLLHDTKSVLADTLASVER